MDHHLLQLLGASCLCRPVSGFIGAYITVKYTPPQWELLNDERIFCGSSSSCDCLGEREPSRLSARLRSLPSEDKLFTHWCGYAISPDWTLRSLNLRLCLPKLTPEGEEGLSKVYDTTWLRDPGDGNNELFSCVMSRVGMGGIIGIASTTIAGISTCAVSAGWTSLVRKRHTILCR